MTHAGHELVVCGTCGTTISQCRCRDEKPVKARAGRCETCKGKTIYETVAMRISNGIKTMPRAAASSMDQAVMEAVCGLMASEVSRNIQDALKAEGMNRELGFALIVFDFEDSEGSMAYAGNADRADFVRVLDELRGKLAATMAAIESKRTD